MTKNDAVERATEALAALDRVEQKSGPPYMLAYDFINGWDKETRVAHPGYGAVVREGLKALQTSRPDADRLAALDAFEFIQKDYTGMLAECDLSENESLKVEGCLKKISAALQSGDKGRWMPIESAPRDGTEIIILEEIGNIASAVCAERKDIWVSPDGAYGYEPIMWMPRNALPAQPTSEGM